MDGEIGKVLDYLKTKGLLKNSVIAIIGDHGEGLGEFRKHIGHIHFLRPQYIRVPQLLYFPDRKGKKIDQNVSMVDFLPTIINYYNFQINNLDLDGKDLFRRVKNRKIYSFTYRPQSFYDGVNIIEDNIQFLLYRGNKSFQEFLDLTQDSGYRDEDASGVTPQHVTHIRALRKEALKILNLKKSRTQRKKSKQTKDILKSLGYID